MELNFNELSKAFDFNGTYVSAEPFGMGHINDTYAMTFKNADNSTHRYVLQCVNNKIFPDIEALMHNIVSVTQYLKTEIKKDGGDPDRETLEFLPSTTGDSMFYHTNEYKQNFRAYRLVENAQAYQKAENPEMFADAGRAFGTFVRRLNKFPAHTLHEIIAKFHDTKKRFKDFQNAVKNGAPDRLKHAAPDIEFALARQNITGVVVDLLASKTLPTRVTHNDTKLNNVLFDETSGRAICVIDLDTIMPGSLLYDFGDAIRSGCNTGLEDEPDLTRVNFDKTLYNAFSDGFLTALGSAVTKKERELLPFSAKLMTYECGIRFLGDYLTGDTYFKTKYADHNLVRARTQFKMVADMEKIFPAQA